MTENTATDLRTWAREDLVRTARAAGELWNSTSGDDPYDVLSELQKALLDRAAAGYLAADQAADMADMAAEMYAACDHATACGCTGLLAAELIAEFGISQGEADQAAARLWDEQGEPASTTPVADALAEVDQAQSSLPVNVLRSATAELVALRKLADAVRSHGIGADLGAHRAGEPAVPVPGVTVSDGFTVIAVMPAELVNSWYVAAADDHGRAGTWAVTPAAAGGLHFSSRHLFESSRSIGRGNRAKALDHLAERASLRVHTPPF
jgi:hypothetical protein